MCASLSVTVRRRARRAGQRHALRPDAEVLLHCPPELADSRRLGSIPGPRHGDLPPDDVHRLEPCPDLGHLLQTAIGEIDRFIRDEGDFFAVELYLERSRDETPGLHVEQRPPSEGLFALQDDLCLSPIDQEGGRNPRVV